MALSKLLVATHNPAKITEIKYGLDPLIKQGVELVTLSDLKIRQEPEETGKTYKDNSFLKAKYYSKLSGLPSIADDGGFSIPSLNNEPGVKSKLWLGHPVSDEKLIEHTLFRLQNKRDGERKAFLETCIVFYDPKSKIEIYETEKINGYVAKSPFNKWIRGFPFRALLITDKFNKYYDELTDEEHKQINHRLIALRRLVKKIQSLVLK